LVFFFLKSRENIPEIESSGVRAYFKVCLDHELFTPDIMPNQK